MNKALIFLLLACHLPLVAQIHAELKPYHDRFVNEAKARGITTMPVTAPAKMQFFSKTGTGIHGGVFFAEKSIYFSQSRWNTASENEREILVFHELAHYYFHTGHIRHADDIMNPNYLLADYSTNRSKYLDLLFQKLYETPMNRSDMTLRSGDIIVCSDSEESETFRYYILNDDTPEKATRSMVILDSIRTTHQQFDYINNKGWRFKPYLYNGINPIIQYDGKIFQVWGEMNRIYMYAANINKAPKLGANARIRWFDDTEMTLVIDYKNTTIPVRRHPTIIYYVKNLPSVAEGKQQINIP